MRVNPEIFREYDIRGIADRDLAAPISIRLGQAVGTYLKREGRSRITLARDCRLSSERLSSEVGRGLQMTGLEVIDIGVVPTPLLYFSLHHFGDVDGGVMITGSHNPADYNGLKVSSGKTTIHGEEIQKIGRILEGADLEQGSGGTESREIEDPYRRMVREGIGRLSRPLKIVVDAGNGTASDLAPRVYRELGCEVVELFCEMDGSFPNHHPDPTVAENLKDLVAAVQQKGADLGIAFDGDGDRIGAVDDTGRILWGDELMILFSREILARHPGATIIGEVKCSMNLYRQIESHGGVGIMWKAGHSLIKAKMKETGAALAGEVSGHIFFADGFFGFDDATYAGARLLQLVADSGQRISQLLEDVPPLYNTPEIRVDAPESEKFEIVRRLQDYFSRHYETVTVDGVRVLFEDGWGLVRASNTQPALVLRFEASSPDRLEEIRSIVESKLEEVRRGPAP